jgi:hypothetical protein
MYAVGESCTNVNAIITLAPNYKSGFRDTFYSTGKPDVTG